MNNRQAFLKVHRWLGLCLALLFVVQGGTGIALVFRDEIEPVIHSELQVSPTTSRFSIQRLFDTVQASHPDAMINRAELPASTGQAVLFKLKRKADQSLILVAIDPYRNTIVRDGGLSVWPIEWLFVVHEQLLSGPTGEYVVGLEGIVLFVMSVTGLWYWWPGRARFRKGFRVVWGNGTDARWRTLHRAVGAAAGPFLLMTALTGILMVWKEPLREFIGAAGKPTPVVTEQIGRSLVPLDDLVATAQTDFGSAPLRQIRFSSGGRVIAIYLDSNRTIRPDGTAQYYYNGYDGAEIATYIAGELSPSSEFVDWIYTVHTGLWGGWLGRLLVLTAGVVLVGLSVTGPWLWYLRRSRRKASRRRSGAIGSAVL
jgi:uncharacterized iron-regulated membrane protein